MIAISIQFTAGRYHATPWASHVNEGVAEWPPSPWRLLRSLVAVWQRTMPDIPEPRMRALLGKMAALPQFHLPPATMGHTRHYMPQYLHGTSSQVFDTFVVVDRERPVYFLWPDSKLQQEEGQLLSGLLERLPFLGRAESWCQAALVSEDKRLEPNVMPAETDTSLSDSDVVRVLTLSDWNGDQPLAPGHPLLIETDIMRSRQRRLDPPGSRWQVYRRPRHCFGPHPLERQEKLLPPIRVVRYALDARPLPRVQDAIRIGELAHQAAISKHGRLFGTRTSLLSGKDAGGKALRNGNRHAFYLPTDEDGDGKLDHLTIAAEDPFSSNELQALQSLTELNAGNGGTAIRLLMLGQGTKDKPPISDQKLKTSLLGCSEVWHSVTPFVLSRHSKKNGKDSPAEQVRLELSRRGMKEPQHIEMIERPRSHRQLRWLEFRRWRSRQSPPAGGLGYGFKLIFEQPVQGPIALGYGCHFGLGLFVPDKEEGE